MLWTYVKILPKVPKWDENLFCNGSLNKSMKPFHSLNMETAKRICIKNSWLLKMQNNCNKKIRTNSPGRFSRKENSATDDFNSNLNAATRRPSDLYLTPWTLKTEPKLEENCKEIVEKIKEKNLEMRRDVSDVWTLWRHAEDWRKTIWITASGVSRMARRKEGKQASKPGCWAVEAQRGHYFHPFLSSVRFVVTGWCTVHPLVYHTLRMIQNLRASISSHFQPYIEDFAFNFIHIYIILSEYLRLNAVHTT